MGQAGIEHTTMIRDPDTLEVIQDSIRKFVNEALIPRENEVAGTDEVQALHEPDLHFRFSGTWSST